MAKRSIKERLPQLTTKAKVIVGLVFFVFILAIGSWIVLSIMRQQIIASKGYDIDQIGDELAKKSTTERKYQAGTTTFEAMKDDDDEKATDIYNKAIEVEKDPTQKVKLAIQRSDQLNGFGKYDDALKVALKAETYSEDKFLISNWLARLYEFGKDYKQAEKYYKLAAALVDSPTNDTGFNKLYFDAKITYIKSLSGK